MSVIYLIRHGQASFGDGDYDRLSDLGHAQARLLGEALAPRVGTVEGVVTGTMRRHRETMDGCMAAFGSAPKPIELPAFDEYDHREVIARFEPRYADEREIARDLASAEDPLRHFQEFFVRATARWASGEHNADYAEPWPRFRARVLAGFDDLAARVSHAGTALVFTSGGPIAVLAAHLIGADAARAFSLQWRFVNAGVTKIVTGRRGPAVVSLNEHAHLEVRGREFVTYR